MKPPELTPEQEAVRQQALSGQKNHVDDMVHGTTAHAQTPQGSALPDYVRANIANADAAEALTAGHARIAAALDKQPATIFATPTVAEAVMAFARGVKSIAEGEQVDLALKAKQNLVLFVNALADALEHKSKK